MRPKYVKFPPTSIPRERLRFGYLLIYSFFIIAGLILLILSLQIKNDFWSSALNQFSSAILVSGLLSGIFELLLRQEFIEISDENTEKILNEILLAKQERTLGLIEVYTDSNSYDYSPLILESSDLCVILNDGRSWISRNSKDLRTRFEDPTKKTTFFLLHPNSEMLVVLAKKVGSTEQALKAKIADTIHLLKEIKLPTTKLEVYGHYLFNPYSLYLGEKEAIITPYFHSRVRKPFPIFKFENQKYTHCFFQELKKDVEDLRHDAEDISNYVF